MIRVTNVAAHRQTEQLAHEVIFQTGTDYLAFVVEVFRADKSNHTVHQERLEYTRQTIRSRLQGHLVDAMMSFGGKSAPLAGFEVHDARALPGHVSSAVVLKRSRTAFAQHLNRNPEASIRRFRTRDGLKQ